MTLTACHMFFLVGCVASLRWEEPDDYAELYITLLGKKGNPLMSELSWRHKLTDVVTPLVQPHLAEGERFAVVRKIPSTRGGDDVLYVVQCNYWFKPDGPRGGLSQAVLDKIILENRNLMPGGLVPEGSGEVTEKSWLRPLWDRCSDPEKKPGRSRRMDLQIKLPAGRTGYILTTCDVTMFTAWGIRDENRPTCMNTRKVITKVRGAGAGSWVEIFKMPIQLSWTNEVKYWMCSFWEVPDRWGDEKSPGAHKLCSVDKTVSRYCTWADSQRKSNSLWEFTGWAGFLAS